MSNDRGNKPVVHTKKHVARLQREQQQTRLILYSFIGILVAVVGLLIYGFVDANYLQLQRPAAKVGKVEISIKDFQTRVRLQRNQLLATHIQYEQIGTAFGMDVSAQLQQIQSQLDSPLSIGQNVINQMVNEELIRQETARRGITVSEEEIQKAIRADLGFFPDGTPSPTVTPTEIVFPPLSPETLRVITATPSPTTTPAESPTATLASVGADGLLPSATATVPPTATPTTGPTNTAAPTFTPFPTSTPYTLEGFQAQYEKGLTQLEGYGLTEEQYRKLYEANILREKLYEIVTADVPHTEEQVWARHILVPDEAAANAVIERLNNGEDFGALAIELSQDTVSGAQGGDLGWFGKGVMVAEFETPAFALEVGEISEPIESGFGWHIIQVVARQDRPLDATAFQAARDKVFSEFLAGLMETIGVEIFDTWQQHVPTEPNFTTLATEAAKQQQEATATP